MNDAIPVVIAILLVVCAAAWYGILRREGRGNRAETRAPGWAAFFDGKQWGMFIRLVRNYFRLRGIKVKVHEEAGIVLDKNGVQYGLLNLAQVCMSSPQAKWPQIISDHLDKATQLSGKAEEVGKQVEKYEQAEGLLAVRIWPEASFEAIWKGKAIYRVDLPGTTTVLVLDFPTTIRNVQLEEAKEWGKSEAELFEKALANLCTQYPPEIGKTYIGAEDPAVVFSGKDFFVASHVLMLERYPECIGRYGALVGIPNRHFMMCYPISTLNVVEAVKGLIPIIYSSEKKGPGSITPNLYWYWQGKFEKLPYEIEGGKVQFFPPEEFVEMLNGMGATER